MKKVFFLILFLSCFHLSWSQTCCTAGAPVSALLNIQHNDKSKFAINMAYEYKSINLLVDGDQVIENDPRSRYGQSFLTKIDYSLNKKWAFSVLTSLRHQSRRTFSSTESSVGIGDVIGITQFTLYSSLTFNINLSAGLKIPSGRTNHRDNSGIILSPDMQTGTGSIDYFAVLGLSKRNVFTSFGSIVFESYYRNNGINSSFASTDNFSGRRFGFGDEWSTNLSFNYQFIKTSGFYIPDIGLKHRWTSQNIEQQSVAPNSGGNWLSLIAGFSYLSENNKSIRIYTEYPLIQRLQGLQISTNFTMGIQFRYLFETDSKNTSI